MCRQGILKHVSPFKVYINFIWLPPEVSDDGMTETPPVGTGFDSISENKCRAGENFTHIFQTAFL